MDRNGAIDGWRGLSVILVLIGHLIEHRFVDFFPTTSFQSLSVDSFESLLTVLWNIAARPLGITATLGVSFFFLISGYLITTLMWFEEKRRGEVSLQAFYIRRIFRILPAFLFFLCTLFVVSYFSDWPVTNTQFFHAGTFTCNLWFADCGWMLGHTWSLAVEEQFYIVWPLLFLLLPSRFRLPFLFTLLFFLIGISPWQPWTRPFALLAIGAIWGLSSSIREFFRKRILHWHVYVGLTGLAVSSLQFAQQLLPFQPFLIAIVLFGTLEGKGPLVGIVSNKVVQLIGVASYSIYLWQQMFTGTPDFYREAPILGYTFLLCIPVFFSYFVVEKPFIRLGRRLSNQITGKSQSVNTKNL